MPDDFVAHGLRGGEGRMMLGLHVPREDRPGNDVKNNGDALRTSWLFLSITLAFTSGTAQLMTSGIGRVALGAIFAGSLIFLLAHLVHHQIAVRLTNALSERDDLRDALHYVLDSADAPLTEKIHLVVSIGKSEKDDGVQHEVVTTTSKPLRYRTFYPILPDTRRTPSFETMDFTGTVASPRSASLDILPIQKGRWVRVVALFRPAVSGSCHWIVSYRSPGLWNPLRDCGRDTLIWRIRRHPGTADQGVAEMTIRFVPPTDTSITVIEREGRGTVNQAAELTGSKDVTWHVPNAGPTDVFVLDLRLFQTMGDRADPR
jgi:hypothetical protein